MACDNINTGRYPIIPCLLSVCFDDAMHGRYAQFYVNKGIRVRDRRTESEAQVPCAYTQVGFKYQYLYLVVQFIVINIIK